MTSPIDRLAEETQALEPGDVQTGEFLQRPAVNDANQTTPGTIVSDLTSAGYSYLYDTRTFEPSLVNNNMREVQLKTTREDGTRVFTAVYPGAPWRGSVKCFLHPDQSNHEALMAMGFKACYKSNIPNPFEAGEHARHRHTTWWKAYQDKEQRLREDDDREIQREIAQAMTGNLRREPDVVEPEFAPESPVEVSVVVPRVDSYRCSKCKSNHRPSTGIGRRHKKHSA